MPTITLHQLVKRFDASIGKQSVLAEIAKNTARGIGQHAATVQTQGQHIAIEPANREHIIDQLSLTINDGETLALLGPSGCGKTTLLRIIAGLIEPDSGTVQYDGMPLAAIPMSERGIGMVFQSYALFPHLRAEENIGFFDLIRRRPDRIPERIRHVSEVMGVDIHYLLDRKPPTLSGGEQQRVAVARCLARDPKLFLFDEPLSNLDAKLRTSTRIQIKRLLRHYKITAVYVTHDQLEAIALADRIAIMNEGKIEQVGTYADLYQTPLNVFIAGFFGNPPMNLFPGTVQGTIWRGKGFEIAPIRQGLRDGQGVQLGIRPEHVYLKDDGAFSAQVELIEPILPERVQLVYLQLYGQSCVAKVPIEMTVRVGTSVHLDIAPTDCYLFDRQSGLRIG